MKTLILIILTAISLYAETVITRSSATLYNENGSAARNIEAETKLQVESYPKDNKFWQLNKSSLIIEKKYTWSLDQVLNNYENAKTHINTELEKDKLELQRLKSLLRNTQIQILETERDSALSYRSRYFNNNGSNNYSYSRVLSSSRARKLVEQLQEQLNLLLTEQENTTLKVRKNLLQLQNIENKTRLYSQIFTDDASNLHIITKDNAAVYRDTQVVQHLKTGAIIKARPHPKHSDFHQIILNKKIFSTASSNLRKQHDYLNELDFKLNANLSKIEFLEEQIKESNTSIMLLDAIASQLNADRYLSGYGVVKNLRVQVDPNTLFIIENNQHDQVYVNKSRADKILEKWEEDLNNLKNALQQQQNSVKQLKLQNLAIKKRQAYIKESFAKFKN